MFHRQENGGDSDAYPPSKRHAMRKNDLPLGRDDLRPRRNDWLLRKIGRNTKKDVLEAFRIVRYEIRTKCQRVASEGLTQAEACQLALRIREQRELVRQMINRQNPKHVKRLLRLNRCSRRHLVELVKKAGLDTTILVFK
jgi:hypothetical protein